jgi:predicted DNA-binding transcriptional regulator AlpA
MTASHPKTLKVRAGLPGRRKRDVKRPYHPSYLSAESLAYELDVSRSTVDDFVQRGLLPKPLTVGSVPRFRWVDVEAVILAQNDPVAADGDGDQSAPGAEDIFLRGVRRVASQNG